MRVLRSLLIALLVVLLIGLIAGAVAVFSVNSRNAARPEAVAAAASNEVVSVNRPEEEDWIIFSPTDATPTTGFILYPGGFVDPVAYAPIARDLAAAGFLVTIDPMPLNLAVLGSNGAADIITAFPEVESWAIGGHSLGGAMAAEFTARYPELIDGLALWAAYPAAGTDLSGLDVAAISIYGDSDGVAMVDQVRDGANRLPPDAMFVPIPGGNHTQFGRYGEGLQRGDNPATIGRDEQQEIIVASTAAMLRAIDTSN
jgi:hypothetical protein